MKKITDHKFSNRCGGDCGPCRRERNNECSHVINDYGQLCYKTRDEHAEIEEWSMQQESAYTS